MLTWYFLWYCLTSFSWGIGLNPHKLHTIFLHSVQLLYWSFLSSTLQSGQTLGRGLEIGVSNLSSFTLFDGSVACWSDGVFSSCFCPIDCLVSLLGWAFWEPCMVSEPFRELGDVVLLLNNDWDTVEPLREPGGGVVSKTDESLREVGGVVEGSSWTVVDIRLDDVLRKEEPKPKNFPDTVETAGWGEGDLDRAPLKPKPKNPDSSWWILSDFTCWDIFGWRSSCGVTSVGSFLPTTCVVWPALVASSAFCFSCADSWTSCSFFFGTGATFLALSWDSAWEGIDARCTWQVKQSHSIACQQKDSLRNPRQNGLLKALKFWVEIQLLMQVWLYKNIHSNIAELAVEL